MRGGRREEGLPERLGGMAGGEVEADLVGELDDPSADLEEAQAEGLETHRGMADLLEREP